MRKITEKQIRKTTEISLENYDKRKKNKKSTSSAEIGGTDRREKTKIAKREGDFGGGFVAFSLQFLSLVSLSLRSSFAKYLYKRDGKKGQGFGGERERRDRVKRRNKGIRQIKYRERNKRDEIWRVIAVISVVIRPLTYIRDNGLILELISAVSYARNKYAWICDLLLLQAGFCGFLKRKKFNYYYCFYFLNKVMN